MATFLPSSGMYLDPLGAALGQGMGTGLGQLLEQRQASKDIKNLSDWMKFNQVIQSSRTDMPPQEPIIGPSPELAPGERMQTPPELLASTGYGPPEGLTPMPDMKSQFGRHLQQQMLGAQLMNMVPPNALEQARIANEFAQADLYQAQAISHLNPPAKTYEPQLMTNERGEQTTWTPGDPLPAGGPWKRVGTASENYELIEPQVGGPQKWIKRGEPIPADYRVVRTPASVTNVNMGAASPSERTAIAEGASVMDSLRNLRTLYDTVKTGNGAMAYPGPIRGPGTTFAGAFGMAPAQREEFRAATVTFKNAMIRAITGAQMSQGEAQRIMAQIPDENDPPIRWEAKWKESVKNIERVQQRREEVLQKSGLQTPGMTQMPSASPATKPMTAVNPQTGQRIQSTDGGKTWQPIK